MAKFPITSGSHAYLITHESTSTSSAIFSVPNGTGVLLKVWGLSVEKRKAANGDALPARPHTVTISMVANEIYVPRTEDKAACGCCVDDLIFPDPAQLDETCVSQCKTWRLSAAYNVGIISLPGQYRLHLSDDSLLGSAIVQAVRLSSSDMLSIPKQLFFGS